MLPTPSGLIPQRARRSAGLHPLAAGERHLGTARNQTFVSAREGRQCALSTAARRGRRTLHAYLERSARYLVNPKAPLFLPLRGRQTVAGVKANGIYTLVAAYAKKAGIEVAGLGVHGLRATAATNALEHEADIAKVQAWLGHANISTTRIYDRRQNRPEDSPTYKVKY